MRLQPRPLLIFTFGCTGRYIQMIVFCGPFNMVLKGQSTCNASILEENVQNCPEKWN